MLCWCGDYTLCLINCCCIAVRTNITYHHCLCWYVSSILHSSPVICISVGIMIRLFLAISCSVVMRGAALLPYTSVFMFASFFLIVLCCGMKVIYHLIIWCNELFLCWLWCVSIFGINVISLAFAVIIMYIHSLISFTELTPDVECFIYRDGNMPCVWSVMGLFAISVANLWMLLIFSYNIPYFINVCVCRIFFIYMHSLELMIYH